VLGMDAPSPVNNTFVARLCALFVCNKCYGSPTAATKLSVSACYFFGSLSYMNTRVPRVFRIFVEIALPRRPADRERSRRRACIKDGGTDNLLFDFAELETMDFSRWRILGTKSARREREFTRDTRLCASCIRHWSSSDTWTRMFRFVLTHARN